MLLKRILTSPILSGNLRAQFSGTQVAFPWKERTNSVRLLKDIANAYQIYQLGITEGKQLISLKEVRQGAELAFQASAETLFKEREDNSFEAIKKDLEDVFEMKLADFFATALSQLKKHENLKICYNFSGIDKTENVRHDVLYNASRSKDLRSFVRRDNIAGTGTMIPKHEAESAVEAKFSPSSMLIRLWIDLRCKGTS